MDSNPGWDSLKPYFEPEEWDECGAYEKDRLLNLKKNYEVLKSIGLKPKVPQFMLKRKKTESKSSVKNFTVTANSGSSKNDISEEQVIEEDKPREDSGVLRKILQPQYDNLKEKDLWQKLDDMEGKSGEAAVTPLTKNPLLFQKDQIYLENLKRISKEDYLRVLGLHRKSEDNGKEEYDGMFEDTTIKETIGVPNAKEKEEINSTSERRDIKIDSPSANVEVDVPLENEIDCPSEDDVEFDRSPEKESIGVDLISEEQDVEVDSPSENESDEADSPSENEDVEVDSHSPLENRKIEVDTLSEKGENGEQHAALEEGNLALENDKSVLEVEEGSRVDGIQAEEVEIVKSVSENEDNADNVLEDKDNIDVKCSSSEKEDSADDIAILEGNDVNGVWRKEAGADDIAVLRDNDAEDDNSTSEGEVVKDFSPRSLKISHTYPKRKIDKVCYTEEDVSSDDEMLFCDECDKEYEGDCPVHGPLIHVLDTPVPIGSGPDRAKLTCPAFMSVCNSGIKGAGLGVWTEWGIAKGVVFGPYEGKIVKTLKQAKQSGYAWEIRRRGRPSHYVEASDPSISNWMRFVNCAPCEQRQNLIAFQYNEQIFYRTYKLIPPAAELLVWYGDDFAADLGISLSEDSDTGECQPETMNHIKSLLKTRNRLVSCTKLLRPGENVSTDDVYFTVETEHQQQPNSRTKMRNIFFSKTRPSSQCEEPGTSMEGRNTGIDENGADGLEKNDCERNCTAKAEVVLGDKLKTHHKRSRCNFVKKRLGGAEELSNAAPEEKSMHKCCHCDFKTSYFRSLNRHVNAVHKGLKPHKCPHCEYRAPQASTVKHHVNAVHTGLKPHKCPHCDYRALEAKNIKRHVNAVHMGRKPHKCLHCDYSASEAKNIKQHVNAVHMGLKLHKCPHCEYRASRGSTVKHHVNAVHMGLKPHKCPLCDYRASEASHVKHHVEAVHMGLKPHKCLHCDYRASETKTLKQHVNAVHMGLKPHKCPHCNYSASEAKDLKHHVNAVHMGLKPHKCPHCDFMSAWSQSVRDHVNSNHKKLKS